MAILAVLESDLRALSLEARRKYPAVKDAAEHAILKLRSMSNPSEIAHSGDILRIFLMACEVKSVKLSVIGLSCLQKLISHDAVSSPALKEILYTLKEHAEMSDESVQLKTLQTILIIFQSHLHPENEDYVAQALGISLRLLENSRSSDSVRNTAAATFRQAVALIFDHVVNAESLPASKMGSGSQVTRTNSVTDDVSRSISCSMPFNIELNSGGSLSMREGLTKTGKLGLRLLEDLTALAAGGSAAWLRVTSLQRTFTLDILEFILSNYAVIFRTLVAYEQVLRHQICSLLMTSLRTNAELEGEMGEPSFRRLVLRSVAHVIRLYSSSLVTECEVFLSMLVKATSTDLPLWHRILFLEVLRGFCVEVRTLHLLFQTFDMNPKNTNVVESMVKALARVVSSVQVPDTCEESLVAVAGMFSSKAKGIEWSLDNDASNAAVVVASEAHAITLAVEGLLGVVFTVATLTDEAIDIGEIDSPRCDLEPRTNGVGQTAAVCVLMVDSMWLTILDALSLILTRSQGEAIILEILKGYQAFTQACGVLRAIEPLNSFLASLCKFTISIPTEAEKKSALVSPGSKRSDLLFDQRDNIVLTQKNVQALRTLFNIAHRLHNVLGPSWILVLETLAALDRTIHSPHAITQEASTPRHPRESSGQYSDFNILSSLNSQLFESSALMHISAVKSLLSALHELSNQPVPGYFGVTVQSSSPQIGSIAFSVERMITILVNNMHRVEALWEQVVGHLLELVEDSNPHLRNMALDGLDQSICAVLGSDRFQAVTSRQDLVDHQVGTREAKVESFECSIISPLTKLYGFSQNLDVRAGSLKILLHVLERHGEKLYFSWVNILQMLRLVANSSEKDHISLGFQSVRVIMNDALSTVPEHCLDVCIEVTGEYSEQKTELNISLTAIGLLWAATDFFAKGLHSAEMKAEIVYDALSTRRDKADCEELEYEMAISAPVEVHDRASFGNRAIYERLLFLVFSMLKKLGADDRPEVRNSAIRTLFQTLGGHGQKFSSIMWDNCLWNYVFPILDQVTHLAATSSRDERQGKELGIRGGKTVHMLIHHSRNTAQKQWDETLVLVLGGLARILRSFFPLLRNRSNFWTGWESILFFVKNSIPNGSKEVALAAINCLQTTAISHSPKGDLPMPYLKSILDVYELVLQQAPNYWSSVASKVKQEILHGIGDLYAHAKMMFDNDMYLNLLDIVKFSVRHSKSISDNLEAEFGNLPPLQRTILEILPLLHPSEKLSSMWSCLLRELLCFLPGSDALVHENGKGTSSDLEPVAAASHLDISSGSQISLADLPNGAAITLISKDALVHNSVSTVTGDTIMLTSYPHFGEKLVPVLVDLFIRAPAIERFGVSPEIIQGLGRCMSTRRDNPDGSLWRVAVEGFNNVLVEELSKVNVASQIDQLSRIRLWKEVADVYEIFLVGSCGRALSLDDLSSKTLKADEFLELTVLNVLGDVILRTQSDAPLHILERLVSTLDRCASRTCCLPVESVGLMPPHSSRFSLTCLQKMFSLCCYRTGDEWHLTRSKVSKVAILVLMNRCSYILQQFLIDENVLGDRPLPMVRIEEIVYVLQELARLVIHPDAASALSLPLPLKEGCGRNENHIARAHLFILFPSFCELVVSREARVRELVQVLLRVIATELGLQKFNIADQRE